MMNVLALMELLKNFPPDTPVLLSSDEEGNSIRHLSTYSTEETDNVESYEVNLVHPDEKWDDETYVEVIVLWP